MCVCGNSLSVIIIVVVVVINGFNMTGIANVNLRITSVKCQINRSENERRNRKVLSEGCLQTDTDGAVCKVKRIG